MFKTTILLIFVFTFIFYLGYLLFRLFDKTEKKLLSKFDKKTKLIIHGVLFIMIFWGLKWGAMT